MSLFHSTTVVFSVWFFKHSRYHSNCRYCHIVKNKCWLCLISEYAKQYFCLIGKTLSVSSNSHHHRRILNPVKYDGASCLNTLQLILPSFLFDRVMHLPLIMKQYFILTKLPFKICFFLRIAIKRETWVMTSYLAIFFKKSRKRYIKYCFTVYYRTRRFKVG